MSTIYACPECGFWTGQPGTCPGKSCNEKSLVEVTDHREVELLANGFFLRDDTEMRKEWEDLPKDAVEAYSFSHVSDEIYPFQRIHVFAGSKPWAIEEAYKLFKAGIELTTWKEVNGQGN